MILPAIMAPILCETLSPREMSAEPAVQLDRLTLPETSAT